MNWKPLLFIGIVLVAATVLALMRRVGRFRHTKAFLRRTPMALERMHREWYAHIPFDVFMELWMEVGRCPDVAPELMRPLDRFGVDVGRGLITNDEMDELTDIAQERAQSMGIVVDLARITAVDDYVQTFSDADARKTTVVE